MSIDYNEISLQLHEKNKGKISVTSKVQIKTMQDLSVAYTPGVAQPCKEIAKDEQNVYKYTSKPNLVAVVTDGSAVLGLGDIGPLAAMPVMEGKAILFKEFANIDAFPICLSTKDVDEIVETIIRISPTFGGINLEDISAPRCIEIEQKLKDALNIPVFHDDQHGTAIVVLAAVINALRITKKEVNKCKVVINGSGSAGLAIAKLLIQYGFKNIIMCDKQGILNEENVSNGAQKEVILKTENKNLSGQLKDALVNSDIFIGVSAANLVNEEMVKSMNKDSIIFAMANPIPEIMPDIAKKAGARIVGTGRSDFPNQINNVLAFPGIFRGALDAKASAITEEMKMSAAKALAFILTDDELNEDNIIPNAFDPRVVLAVSKAVYDEANREKK